MRADPLVSISARGGLAARHELVADGASRADISREMDRGTIIRVRQGWYAEASISPVLLRATRVGGRLTCLSALAMMDIWTPPFDRLHVAVDPHQCRLRSPADSRVRRSREDALVVHWREHPGRSRLIVDPIRALEDAFLCISAEMLTAACDSLIRRQPQHRAELQALSRRAPLEHGSALARADGVSESGIESLFWLRMQRPAPRRQVLIRGIGRVDFLFGDRLVVEIDGAEFHRDVDHFEQDRRRDALLSARGYRVLRFSYRQVMFDWQVVEFAIRAALSRGDHY